mgnify:CR=1 FL=1
MSDGKESVDDKEFLRLFALSADPVLTAPEFAERFSISNQAVNKRLKRLERDGIVDSKKVGSAAKVYWLSPEGRSKLAKMEFSIED